MSSILPVPAAPIISHVLPSRSRRSLRNFNPLNLGLALAGTLAAQLLPAQATTVLQGAGAEFVAFEAETTATLIAGTPENWVVKADADASGGAALYADGVNTTVTSPHSFAQLQLKFATAGTYSLYYRWKADPARTGNDAFTANSSWIGNRFAALSAIGTSDLAVAAVVQADYLKSDSNASAAPADNFYVWHLEPAGTYTVAAGDLGTVQTLTVGTREAGMFFDRFVLSTDATLTSAQLDSLVNSGTKPPAPVVKSAIGSGSLNTVALTFTRPLKTATVVPGNFKLGTINVSAATLDPDDARIVVLTTGAQTQGTVYTVTVNGVQDVDGTSVQPNTKAQFTAWKLVNGWALKEIYFSITGTTVAELEANPNYQAHKPTKVEWVKGFQLNQAPLTDNYGARLSTFWTPGASSVFDLLLNNDDEAELRLSTDTTEANLASLGVFPLNAAFDDAVVAVTPMLTAGKPYLLAGLLKQGGGDVYLNVGVRRQGSGIPAATVPLLNGARIATYVNPDLGKLTFTQQPAPANVAVGGRGTFKVVVSALTGPVYYQWQLEGVDIPGATRATYITPVLGLADSGKAYGCVVSVAGTDTASTRAALTVTAGGPASLQPYIGVNLVGGGTLGGGTLTAVDVAGVVRQENWNNLAGLTFTDAALNDASGAVVPVTLTDSQDTEAWTELWYTGTISTGAADGVLLQGYVNAGASKDPRTFTLNNVPVGKYQLIAYSLGFDFTPDYVEAFSVAGAGTYPTYHVKAETGLPYQNNPAFRRMSSTDAAAPDTGNYVQFDNVSPAADGSLTLSVTWESAQAGNGHQPALNGLQLVKVLDLPVVFTATQLRGSDVVLTWTGGSGPFLVQGKLGLNDAWLDLKTTTERTATIPLAGLSGFFRIVDGTTKSVKLFKATMNGANERTTPVTTPGTGVGLLALDGLNATYLVHYQNLSSAPSAYHLHGLGTAEQAVGVKFGLVPSGALTASGGQFAGQSAVDQATADGIVGGLTYFNLHTGAHGGGEIRGQLLP